MLSPFLFNHHPYCDNLLSIFLTCDRFIYHLVSIQSFVHFQLYIQPFPIFESFWNSNNLSGTIPSNIGDLLQISYLYLDDNDLMGHIPDGLGKTHKENAKEGNLLKEVWLQDNQLSGTVPVLLAELDNLIK